MKLEATGEVEVAETLDRDNELEIEVVDSDGVATVWLTESQANDLAEHILKVLSGEKA